MFFHLENLKNYVIYVIFDKPFKNKVPWLDPSWHVLKSLIQHQCSPVATFAPAPALGDEKVKQATHPLSICMTFHRSASQILSFDSFQGIHRSCCTS